MIILIVQMSPRSRANKIPFVYVDELVHHKFESSNNSGESNQKLYKYRFVAYVAGAILLAAFIDSCLSYFTEYTISSGLWFVYRRIYAFWKYIESWVVYLYLNLLESLFVYLWNKFELLWRFLVHVIKNFGKSLVGIVHPILEIVLSGAVFLSDLAVAFYTHTASKLRF